MVVRNLIGVSASVSGMAQLAQDCGARVSGGTDMRTLCKALETCYGIKCAMSSSRDVLLSALRGEAVAIANVGGNRGGYKGVFSDGGHYVVVAGAADSTLLIADPGLYAGKYLKSWRRDVVRTSDGLCYADVQTLDADCANRAPKYYIFTR